MLLSSLRRAFQWASRGSIRTLWQTGHLSCWIDCQKIEKGACLELWMPPLNAAPRAVSETGLGSVIAALDAEFWATM